jgi:hypothetical protein
LCYLVLSCGEWEDLVPDRKSIVQVKFRLRKDILRQLERSAKACDRSVNAEIAHRLEQSFEQEDIITTIKEAADNLKNEAARAGFIAGFNSDRDAPLLESFKADARRSGLFKDDAQIVAAFKREFKELGIDPNKPKGEEDK